MTEIGRDEYGLRLEQELRAAAPQARALFVDELARRVHNQRFRLRPTRFRMGLALAFSTLMIVALGVLGAPGYVAHAATAVVQTAKTALSGGSPTPTVQAAASSNATSGTDQYAIDHGICHRTPTGFVLITVSAGNLDTYAAGGDIVPAPPWGCPPKVSKGGVPRATTTTIQGPNRVTVLQPATFNVTVGSADGKTPQGTVSCFDNLHRFANAVALGSNGKAACTTRFLSVGTHAITVVFKTADVNKWASSAGNVVNVSVARATPTLTLASSLSPAPFGAGVTFTASATGPTDIPAPGGTVQFFDGTTPLGSADLAAGTAPFRTSALTVGSHTIKAAYSGDDAYEAADATVSQVVQAVADRLVVTTARPNAGSGFSTTVTAEDALGNVATEYSGTVHFASSDPRAALPADYTFGAGDNGSHTFNVTLKTAGSQTLIANSGSISGSADIAVSPAAADHVVVSVPTSAVAGNSFSATVTARDAYDNIATGYTGTVQLASSDPRAVLPADYTFAAADNGAHTLTGIVLKTAGSQTVSATDAMAETITGNTALRVDPAAADHLTVTGPAVATAGSPVSVTVTAKDVYGNTATGYVGGIHFSSTDPRTHAGAGLPADYTFAAADNGTHTFTGAVALVTAGSRTITATDTVLETIVGTTPAFIVSPAAAATIAVTAPASVTAGDDFSATLTAKDAYGNTATGFTGAVHFSSSDAHAKLPADYTFVAPDHGSHTFRDITFKTAGAQSLAAHAAGSIAGAASVAVAAPSKGEQQQPAAPQPVAPPAAPQPSASTTADPAQAGSVTVAPSSGTAAPTTVAWAPSTFGTAPAHVSATAEPPAKTSGVQFATGSAVIQIDAVTDAGQPITTLNDVLDIAIPKTPGGVAPMYQRGDNPWVVIPRLSGTTLPAGQPDGWYRDGSTIHILTRHLTKFGLATALDVKWGTRRRVHLRWAQRIVIYGAPNVDSKATYTLRRGKKVYGTWTRTLPAGKGAPANLWLTGKKVVPGLYRLTIVIQAGPQRWTQVVAIRYL